MENLACGIGMWSLGHGWGECGTEVELGMQNREAQDEGGVPVMKAGTPQPSM